MFDLEGCFERGLLQKSPYAESQVKESIQKAERLLEEAKNNFKSGSFDSTLVFAYSAAFNAARAILFKDGYREKSHECVVLYLDRKHPEISSDLIALLNKYRTSRHGVLYDIRYSATKAEAEESLDFAGKFIRAVKKAIY